MASLFEFLRHYLAQDYTDLYSQAIILRNLVVLAWSIHVLNALAGYGFNQLFGLRPLQPGGILGIFTAHFFHWSLSHILGNTLAFVPLAWFISAQGIKLFYVVSVAVAILSGFGVWILGRPGSLGAGASCVIYGYLGFLLVYGATSGSLPALVIAIAVGLVYYRFIPGILPTRPGIGWEGHLFGFFSGILAALVLSDIALSY